MESNGYIEIGAVLRAAREDRQLELWEVGKMLHIRPRYLDALERGQFSELPGLPYAKGYLQTYASFLELDKDELVRRFEREADLISRRGFFLPQAFHSDKKPHHMAVWGSLAALLLLYVLWQALFQETTEEISVVEHFVPPKIVVTAQMARDVACVRPQEALYPTCYMNPVKLKRMTSFSLVPLIGQPATVMQLWDKQFARASKPVVKEPEVKEADAKPAAKPVAKPKAEEDEEDSNKTEERNETPRFPTPSIRR